MSSSNKFAPRNSKKIKALQPGGFADIFVDIERNICYKIFRDKAYKKIEFKIARQMMEKYEELPDDKIQNSRILKYLECGEVDKYKVFEMYMTAFPKNDVKVRSMMTTYFAETTVPYIAMEYIPGRDGMSYGLKYGYITDDHVAANVLHSLLLAVQELHSMGYLHRDIKPDNFIMYKKNKNSNLYTIKLVDLGLAAQKPAHSSQSIIDHGLGTKEYCSPEALLGKHSVASDIFAAGMSIRVLCGYDPKISSKLQEILLQMTHENPTNRGTIEHILKTLESEFSIDVDMRDTNISFKMSCLFCAFV